eukprot:3461271-Amphidinium_carterae.1
MESRRNHSHQMRWRCLGANVRCPLLDQAAEGEVARLSAHTITSLYTDYSKKRGGMPHPDHD